MTKKGHDAPCSAELEAFHERSWARLQARCGKLATAPFGSKVVGPASLLAAGGMPRVRTDPVPSCSGCDPAVERGHTTLPTEDAPVAHYRATQCAVCRMVVSLRSLTFHALLQPDGDLYLYLGVHIPAIPSLRHHLHHVSIGVVKPHVRVDLLPILHHMEQLVAAHRQHITHVRSYRMGEDCILRFRRRNPWPSWFRCYEPTFASTAFCSPTSRCLTSLGYEGEPSPEISVERFVSKRLLLRRQDPELRVL